MWSDDFNDENYDGWTVLAGTFIVEDGILKTGPGDFNTIRCPSYGPATGTWSFDVLANGYTVVYFVGTSQQIYLTILFTGGQFYVQRLSAANNTFSQVRFPGKASAWQHINVTRNQDGRICVYNNGTLFVDYVDVTFIPSPDFFEFFSAGESAIDNIVISDTVDIQPPAVPFYKQPWFIPSIAAVVVVVVVIVIFLMRRK
jgi:hypothetical protein